MDIILTKHAKKRLIKRAIKIEQIKETINFPNYKIYKNNKIEAFKEINNKLLKVI